MGRDELGMDVGREKKVPKAASWILPGAIVAPIAVIAIAAVAYLMGERHNGPPPSLPSGPPAASAVATSPSVPAPPTTPAPQKSPAQQTSRQAEALVPETVPFIAERSRATIRNEYMPAADHKALAISSGPIGFTSGQADDETAKTVALEICQKRADVQPQQRKCELYALGNSIVYAGGRPPMPATPWVRHDPATTRPLVANDVPLLRPAGKAAVEKNYLPARAPKALALGPVGGFHFLANQDSADDAVRRVLDLCRNNAGGPCVVLAVNGDFVVPIPLTMKVVGFFQPPSAAAIPPDPRDHVAR